MDKILIVDGYNMIGAWPQLKSLKNESLEAARDRLIDLLADYQAFSGIQTIVVFDAHQVPGPGGKYKQKKVLVLFTKEKETADECIERLVSELSGKNREIFVATSDHVEQHIIFGKGALRVSARELLLEMEEYQRQLSEITQEKREPLRGTFDSRLDQDLRKLFEQWRRNERRS